MNKSHVHGPLCVLDELIFPLILILVISSFPLVRIQHIHLHVFVLGIPSREAFSALPNAGQDMYSMTFLFSSWWLKHKGDIDAYFLVSFHNHPLHTKAKLLWSEKILKIVTTKCLPRQRVLKTIQHFHCFDDHKTYKTFTEFHGHLLTRIIFFNMLYYINFSTLTKKNWNSNVFRIGWII